MSECSNSDKCYMTPVERSGLHPEDPCWICCCKDIKWEKGVVHDEEICACTE